MLTFQCNTWLLEQSLLYLYTQVSNMFSNRNINILLHYIDLQMDDFFSENIKQSVISKFAVNLNNIISDYLYTRYMLTVWVRMGISFTYFRLA